MNFHGEKRSNETHASTTDQEAMLTRKGFGKESKLSYCGNVIMENRTGPCVAANLETADGKAERRVLALLRNLRKTRYRGKARAGFHFIFTMAAADLVILAGKL